MKTIRFKIEGTQPMLQKNPQTVNPFNKFTKELKPLTAKKKKSDEDNDLIYRIQFESCFYINGSGQYIIPATHFWKSVTSAAKEQKLGKKFEQSFCVFEDCILDFPEKNLTPEQLYDEQSHVDIRDTGIKGSRIPACRAIFNDWSTIVECYYDENEINTEQVIQFMEIAGRRYGVGTYRQKFGRFNATVIK